MSNRSLEAPSIKAAKSGAFTLPQNFDGFRRGYYADAFNAPDSCLSSPSINMEIDKNGRATQRLGYMQENIINLGGTANAATSFYLDKYDVTVFCYGTAVKYYDWTTQKVYDTGLTLTAGTRTRMDAYSGDIYLTNTTDGLRRLVFFKTTAAIAAGDASIHLESDAAARLSVFSINSGNLIMQGTTEAFTQPTTGTVSGAVSSGGLIKITTAATQTLVTGMSVTLASVGGTTEANGTWTITVIDSTHFTLNGSVFANAYTSGGTWTVQPNGVLTLTTTASKAYASGAVGVLTADISSTREKASKVFFWKERMGLIGSISATNANAPTSTVYFSAFANATALKNITTFNYGGNDGSDMELVGYYGKITNALATKDFVYAFKSKQAYTCAASSVTISGAGIGATPFDLRDEIHGCINEDCACSIGNNEIAYITNDKRIMRIVLSTSTGAPVTFPDESFDVFIQSDLLKMDADQTGALAFYHAGKKRSYYQIKISGQWYWYIYDHGLPIYIPTAMGTNIIYGAWYPPQQVLFAQSFFERQGILYATDGSNDSVYSIGTSFDDNGLPVNCALWTGNFAVGSAEMQNCDLQGQISESAVINMQCLITNTNGGQVSTSLKTLNGNAFSYGVGAGIGISQVGAGDNQTFLSVAEWEKNFDIYPSEANRIQFGVTSDVGGYFSIEKYALTGKSYPSRSSSL